MIVFACRPTRGKAAVLDHLKSVFGIGAAEHGAELRHGLRVARGKAAGLDFLTSHRGLCLGNPVSRQPNTTLRFQQVGHLTAKRTRGAARVNLMPVAPGQTTLGSARSESGTLSVRGGSVGGSFLPSATDSWKMLRRRMRQAHETALVISRALWQRQEVPVSMCCRQGTILRQWDELQTLGGQGS